MFSFYLTNSKKKKETAQIIIKTQIYLITCEVTRENVQKKKKSDIISLFTEGQKRAKSTVISPNTIER